MPKKRGRERKTSRQQQWAARLVGRAVMAEGRGHHQQFWRVEIAEQKSRRFSTWRKLGAGTNTSLPEFCARFMSRCLGKAAATVEGERSRPYGAPGQRGARPHDECQSRLTWRYVGTRTRMTNAAAA